MKNIVLAVLFGTMCGFVTAAILTFCSGEEVSVWIPSAVAFFTSGFAQYWLNKHLL